MAMGMAMVMGKVMAMTSVFADEIVSGVGAGIEQVARCLPMPTSDHVTVILEPGEDPATDPIAPT